MDADLVARGGPVWTGSTDQPDARGVVLDDGQVVAVGDEAEVSEWIGPSTRVVDLDGGLALPGFIDAHVHPVQAGLDRLGCDLSAVAVDEGAYVDAIGRFARSRPDDEWVLGGGWSMPAFSGGVPTRAALDQAVSDRPAYLPNRDRHGAWVNSEALRRAGIDAATPDPADGRIERDAEGVPTGMLHEGAMNMVGALVPDPSSELRRDALLIAQRHLHSVGVVAWQDAIVGNFAGSGDVWTTYVSAAQADLLTARVTGALWWDREQGTEQIEGLVERRRDGHVGRFRPLAVKIMVDGVVESFTAAMTEPYLDVGGQSTGHSGQPLIDAEALTDAVVALDGLGFQVHVHAIGDRAIREALDAFATARDKNGPSGGRHHLAHLQVVHPDDMARFAALDVTANMQALWACHEPQMDDLTLPFLGTERSAWQYPFGDLHRLGTRLACGSDWPVSSPDPLAAVKVAVTRTEPGASGPPLLPEQALSLPTALRAYTAGSAYVTHDDRAGTLQPGSRGDLVVLDRDLFETPAAQLDEAIVDLTVVDGQVVYER